LKTEKMKECKWYRVCPMKRFFEAGKLEKKWVMDYCHGGWDKCERFRMEEKGQYHPDNMLPNGEIDESLSD
jgi:hypothetical protein